MAEDLIPAGQWGTVAFEIPDFLDKTRKDINDIATLLIDALNIAIQALNLVKAYATAYIDPTAALVQLVIDQIKKMLTDFRQLGIYLTGDWGLMKWPYEDIRGGFTEYERRMISRLVDRSDPTRPDVSSGTSVVAAFFYLSADLTSVERVVSFVKMMTGLFHLSFYPASTLPVPVVSRLEYGNSTTGVFGALDNLLQLNATPPSKVRLTWKVAPLASRQPFNPFPALGPGGFIVTVSTLREGIPLMYDRPKADTSTEKNVGGTYSQPREYGQVRDVNGMPIVLYGGIEMVQNPYVAFPHRHISYNEAVEGPGKAQNGIGRVYGVKSLASNEIIPIELLFDGGETFFLQRTFFVGFEEVAFEWATMEYHIVLDSKDMPHLAEFVLGSDGKFTVKDLGPSSTYYVRVASTTKEVANEGVFRYDLNLYGPVNAALAGQPYKVPLQNGRTPDSVSGWSQPSHVLFPNANTPAFLDSVTKALVVLALSRADLPLVDSLTETKGKQMVEDAKAHKVLLPQVALLATGLEAFAPLLNVMYQDYTQSVEAKGQSPKEFRQDLLRRAQKMAKDLHARLGSRPDLEQYVVQSTQTLRKVTWGEILLGFSEAVFVGLPEDGDLISFLKDIKEVISLPAQENIGAQEGIVNSKGEVIVVLDEGTSFGAVPDEVKFSPGSDLNYGLAPNPYSLGIGPEDAGDLFLIPGLIRGRKPHFIEFTPDKKDFAPQYVIPAEDAPVAMALAAPSLRMFYERFKQKDGSILVPSEVVTYLNVLKETTRTVGSADLSPVFYNREDAMAQALLAGTSGPPTPDVGMVYCRSLLGNYKDGVLFRESAVALGLAASAFRRPIADGQWIAIRFFDTFPGLEGFFESISNWLDALSHAIKSVADAIVAYINFIEGRLVEMQQLIRRIDSLLESILGFSVAIPQCSALLVVAKGTDGVLSSLVTAKNKPSDSPLAYGAGIAVLLPTVPAFFMDLLILKEGGQDTKSKTTTTGVAGALGVESLPPPPLKAPDDPPDVL